MWVQINYSARHSYIRTACHT